jgi:predicted RecB family nuclease
MEILSFLKTKKKKQFVSETDFIVNQGKQFRAAIESLVTLRDSAIEEDDELKMDYFFYTNTLEKAQKLEKEIQKIDYIVNHAVASHDKKLFVISGRTTEMKMMHETLSKWVGEMCELGYKYDCSFENWKIVSDSN